MRSSVSVCFGFVLSAISCLVMAQAHKVPSQEVWLGNGLWPHERSEVKPNPAVYFGKLENGFRYAIIPNDNPKGRVTLHLNVQVGSLMEEENERGVAHFVEHMAFNGSRSFPAGTLIPFFQKHGMSFGGDSNAHTSFYETVYKLDLPTTQADDLQVGLTVLRDFADGISFPEAEVKRERGVVLAEKVSRDSEAYQAGQRQRAVLFPNSRFTSLPIGTEEVIKNADTALLKAFYERWYTPKRMILVAAGDIEPKTLEQEIKATFGSMKPQQDIAEIESWGDPIHKGLTAYYDYRSQATGTFVTLTAMLPRDHKADSEETQKQIFLQALTQKMLNDRLQREKELQPKLWIRARASMAESFNLFPSSSISAQTTSEQWQNVVKALEQNVRVLLVNGFTDAEISEAKATILADLKNRVKDYSNSTNSERAAEAVATFNADRVLTSPTQDYERFKKFSSELKRQEVNNYFRKLWKDSGKILYVSGDVKIEGGATEVESVYKQSQQDPMKTYAVTALAKFPYLPLPKVDSMVLPEPKIETIADGAIKVYNYQLPNGMTLQLAPSTLSKERVSVMLAFGDGLTSIEETNVQALKLAEAVLAKNGPGNLSRLDNIRLFGRQKIAIAENYTNHGFVISGSAPTKSIELLLQGMWTEYKDPTPRQDALDAVAQELLLAQSARKNSVPETVRFNTTNYFYGDAARITPLTPDVTKIELDELKALIAQTRNTDKLHLLMVGDFEPNNVLPIIWQLFSSEQLQVNNGVASKAIPYVFPKSGEVKTLKVSDPIDKSFIASAWREDLPSDNYRAFAVRQLLAAVMRDALRVELRENMGASYSPVVRYRVDETDHGFGMYLATVETDTAQLTAVDKALQSSIAEVAKNGVDEATLNRLRAPMLTAWKTVRGKNEIWFRLLQQQYLTGLPLIERNNNYRDTLLSISVQEINKEAANLLKAPAATLIITTDKAGESTK